MLICLSSKIACCSVIKKKEKNKKTNDILNFHSPLYIEFNLIFDSSNQIFSLGSFREDQIFHSKIALSYVRREEKKMYEKSKISLLRLSFLNEFIYPKKKKEKEKERKKI
ncbi:Doublesex- and mab-3-related transcription factor A2 [Sarcoptes scabiei]|nr:Doublesex- and mab-3-related transcription factor A2 [Sarcoptes scabiei]